MQEDASPLPVIHVDEMMIHHDAYRLILNNTHTTAELLELLGTPSPSTPQTTPQGTGKHVRISEEVVVFNDQPVELLHLPPAVALLYHAALAESPVRNVSNLIHMLERLGEPPAPRPRGDVLHEEGMRRIQDIAKWREEKQKAMIEEEIKACTFKPVISDSAKEMAPKGLSTFMEKCIEWKKAAGVRLQKKAAQDRINRGEDEEMTQWKMSDRSRQVLLEGLKKKGLRRNKVWETKTLHTANSLICNKANVSNQQILFNSTVENNTKDVLVSPSFHPVIQSAVGDALTCLRQFDKENTIQDRDDNINNNDYKNTVLCQSDEGKRRRSDSNDKNKKSVVSTYLQRVEEDKDRREERLRKLRIYYAKQAKEQLYEKKTGQPLFQPNAMPTVVKDGKRVKFDELDKKEQHELVKMLQLQHQEYVISRYMNPQRDRQEKLQPRTPDKLITDLLNQSEHQKRLETLRSTIDVEETFHPEICARSRKITTKKSWKPIYERPLPQRQEEIVESSSSFTTPTRKKSSDVCIQRMLTRTENWMQQRSQHLQEMREALERDMAASCSFHPQLDHSVDISPNSKSNRNKNNSESHNSSSFCTSIVDNEALVANAEARMCTELELLRSQAALRDATFMNAVKTPLATITLSTAPRPSRRSVEQYTRSLSSMTSGRAKGSSSCQPRRRGYSLSTSFAVYSDNNNNDSDDSDNDDYYYNGVTSGDYSTQYIDYGDGSGDMQEIADSWALLDAQTDAILKKCQYY